MSRRVIFAPEEFYHIYNRGTERRDIFQSPKDEERFITTLYLSNSSIPVDIKLQGSTLYDVRDIDRGEELVSLCAYCLMPNHFHLLVRAKNAEGISRFMQKLTTSYTMYFNKRYERNGALFQGKFKATHVNDDGYLKHLVSYIHLNPIKLIEPKWKETGISDRSKAEHFLEKYTRSSYLDYIGFKRLENILLQRQILQECFEMPDDFKKNVSAWLQPLQGSTL